MEADTPGHEEPTSVRRDLIERLRSLDDAGSGTADAIFKRAQETLEQARSIRLQAIEDARQTREQEMASLMESLRSLRRAAESQVETVLSKAEIEAARIHDQASAEARTTLEKAQTEASRILDDASAIRAAAEKRAGDVDRLEAEFNGLLTEVVERLGLTGKRSKSWRKRST